MLLVYIEKASQTNYWGSMATVRSGGTSRNDCLLILAGSIRPKKPKNQTRRVSRAATESAYTLAQFNSNADIYCADTPLSYNVLLLNVVYSVSRSFTKRRGAHYLKQEEEEYSIYCGGGYIEGQMELPISHQKETKKVECRCFVTPTDAGAACAPSSRAESSPGPADDPLAFCCIEKELLKRARLKTSVFFWNFVETSRID